MTRLLLVSSRSARHSPRRLRRRATIPSKVIRMIVGFAAGGGNDIFARLIAQKLSERTGWTVIIENKPGAGGRLAADYAAKEAPDGYTVLVGASGAMAIGPIIYKTGYDTLKSFEPVTMIADFPLILVVQSGPSCQDREGAGGVDQGQSRQGELFDLVARLHAADRTVQAAHRRQGRRHSVQEQRRNAARRDFGQRRDGDHRPAADHRAGAGRQAARARGDRREAHARTARRADARRGRRARVSWSDCGAASSCRPARRSRSSTSSPGNCAR